MRGASHSMFGVICIICGRLDHVDVHRRHVIMAAVCMSIDGYGGVTSSRQLLCHLAGVLAEC